MEGIRFIGMSICITCVVTAIFSMLVPSTNLNKVLKFAISLFFLTGLVSPFLNNQLDFHMDFSDISASAQTQRVEQTVENQFVGLAQRRVESLVERILLKENFQPKKIQVFININEEDSISINRMVVIMEPLNPEEIAEVRELVKKEAGIDPEIYTQ